MLETGFNNYISIGFSAQRGELDSASLRLNFYTAKGLLSLRLGRIFSMGLSVGETFFENNEKETIGSAFLKAEEKNYNLTLDYNLQDAAQVLYSPLLVYRRLRTNLVRLSGEYRSESGLLASGYFSYYFVSDHNQGRNLQLRIGKRFGELAAGYEFYYLGFNDSTRLYYTPSDFESHSLWGEWFIVDNKENEVKLGGKVGLIPENNFILREAFLSARVLLAEHFTLQGRLSMGSTIRQTTGYRSASFNIAAYWTF